MVKRINLGIRAWGLALLVLASELATAGSFSVNPVRLTLSANRSSGVLILRNTGTRASVIQVEVVSWLQEDGQDITVATRNILATPPIFTVAAGGSQIVRIGVRQPPDPRRETTYRVILQEVPTAPAAGTTQVALRLSVPVFLPPESLSGALAWEATRTPQGELRVALHNNSNTHIQIAHLSVSQPANQQPIAEQEIAAYVLPQQGRGWIIKAAPSLPLGTSLHILARTDAGNIQADVVVKATP